MKFRQSVAMVLNCALFVNTSAFAAEEKKEEKLPAYRLQWRDLPRMITDHKVVMKLPDGARVQGKVLAIEPDAMVLDITKTSNKHAYPKGHGSIPRAAVTEFRLVKRTGHTWTVVGTAVGAFVGLLLGGSVLAYASNETGITGGVACGAVALIAGPTALGAWGGWVSDKKTVLITVVPEL
jgi:hypothetical protein